MLDLGKKNVLGVMVNAVDYEAATDKIIEAARNKQPFAATALAVHGVMTGVLDPVHRYRLNHLDMITPDGQPVRWALSWLHSTKLSDRVYGPNLMLKICERAQHHSLPIFLYGSRKTVIEALENNLRSLFPNLIIAGKEPSLFRCSSPDEKQAIAGRIRASRAAITFVGLGCPRQEIWAYEYRSELSMPLIAVGAAFDFHSGNLPQAHAFLQRAGLEWFYRLYNEPKRLWKRYAVLNPLYIWCLFLQKTALKKFDPNQSQKPVQEVGYA